MRSPMTREPRIGIWFDYLIPSNIVQVGFQLVRTET